MQFTNRKEMLDIDDNGSQVAQNLEIVNTTEASGIVIHTHTHTHLYITLLRYTYVSSITVFLGR